MPNGNRGDKQGLEAYASTMTNPRGARTAPTAAHAYRGIDVPTFAQYIGNGRKVIHERMAYIIEQIERIEDVDEQAGQQLRVDVTAQLQGYIDALGAKLPAPVATTDEMEELYSNPDNTDEEEAGDTEVEGEGEKPEPEAKPKRTAKKKATQKKE